MNVWKLFLIFEMVLAAVVLILLFVGWCRRKRMVSKAHSPEHRLKIPNVWTEVQQVKNSGSTQMMRMKDGNFIALRVGLDATKVLVSPQCDSIGSFTELASFPIGQSHKDRRQQQTSILNDLRKQIGYPASVSELRNRLHELLPRENLGRD